MNAKPSTPLLDSINSVADIRGLSVEELTRLATELRHDLITRVNQVGGHFASSLGVTELTVALHYCFNTPDDRLVWDVGHQAYIHKILTGRRESMLNVRKLGGISGFPRRDESPYDTFGVAHAGTSISAALGMCEAHHVNNNENRRSIAVIGDGAMTAGMAFEALNHSGHLHRKLIVVLNDNEMSISPNVGALSLAFSRAITARFSTAARRHFKSLTEKGLIPKTFYRALDKAEDATQGFFSTPAMLFSSFGYRYIGPIDGHNFSQLLDAFERAKVQDGPVLIHVLTTKGKGFSPAELDPVQYHAIAANQLDSLEVDRADLNQESINPKTKAPTPLPKTYTQVFGDELLAICRENPKVVGITAAMPDGTGLTTLAVTLPNQFYDVGIAEQHAVTFAAGLACEGIIPVCAIYSTFLQRAYDQIIHDVCIQKLPVIFALDRSGVVGSDGPTHHGAFDLSYLRLIPEMSIMAPKDELELRMMLRFCIQHKTGPIAIRYPRGKATISNSKLVASAISLGKAEEYKDLPPGRVALLSIGGMYDHCTAAEEILGRSGIQASTFNMRFIKPIDTDLLDRLAESYEVIATVEDNVSIGGFGSAICEHLASTGALAHTRLATIGLPDNFVEHGTQAELYAATGLDPAGIARKVISTCAAMDSKTLSSPHIIAKIVA